MPELPEVQTTVNGLKRAVIGLKIVDAWSDYNSIHYHGADNIKDPQYFARFRDEIIDSTIISVERRAKNILIGLMNGKTILIHMKMTGHLLYGAYERHGTATWVPVHSGPLNDPFNRHIHFVLTFSNNRRLVMSDARKFAKITLLTTEKIHLSKHLSALGPEPLSRDFTFDSFANRLRQKPNGKIKQVLMDQKVIAGIGNIYSDEVLWCAAIHPFERTRNLSIEKIRALFKAIKQILSKSVLLGGDSMSDYRDVLGKRGKFQEHHRAYHKTGAKCDKRNCGGTIIRVVMGSRGTHYCDRHQKLNKL